MILINSIAPPGVMD